MRKLFNVVMVLITLGATTAYGQYYPDYPVYRPARPRPYYPPPNGYFPRPQPWPPGSGGNMPVPIPRGCRHVWSDYEQRYVWVGCR